MPVVSQAQRRFMYATKEGKTDVSPSVGEDFINASHGIKGLPERKGRSQMSKAMQAHGYSKGDGSHKRHPSTSHTTAFGRDGNKFRSR